MSGNIDEKNFKKEKNIQMFEEIKQETINNGYKENLGVIIVFQANIYALLTSGPIAIVFSIAYVNKWNIFAYVSLSISFVLYFFASIVIHEFLHGITWSLFCKNGFKSIKFDVMWKSLTPYCHCKEPLNFKAYITSGLMPLLILGILPSIASLFIGNSLLISLSLLNILCAGGHITIVLLAFKYKDAIFIDHPTDCGFVAFTKL